MNKGRIALIGFLIAVPLLAWAGVGSYALWRAGYGFIVWWPLFACASLGYFLAWYWLRKQRLLTPPDAGPPIHWTDRDRDAWKLVEARAEQLGGQERTEFHDLAHYGTLAQEMAVELGRFYHPNVADPLGAATVPEILAVVELAAHDLQEMVDEAVPGSHVMTVNDWRWTRDLAFKATDWYSKASYLWWAASAVFAPIETAVRYAATQAGAAAPLQLFQTNLIAWLHRAYIRRLGHYLIELNSGRLRVGAQRYREMKAALESPDGTSAGKPVELVTLTVLGQAKAGKSSFINALLGAQQAKTDVVPTTGGVTRYELPLPGSTSRLVLLDTVGYAQSGPKEDQVKATQQAAQKSDLLILVLHARNPARQPDLEMLQELKNWYAARPDLKMPQVLAVVTHIDLLSPAMEWSPPYNWQNPQRPKEKQIQDALTAVRDQLGDHLVGAVPLCTAPGKVYGIDEWFLPTLMELLGEARAVALLRCLRGEQDAGKVRRVVEQALTLGSRILDVYLESKLPKAHTARK
jgi:predicted GTPase